jgi:hypothetical protein
MATTTPNYGWPVPTSTDYVKDGATAIEALGDAIDATVFGLGVAGLTLITTSTFSAVASVSVNNCFSATYDNYCILYNASTMSAGADIYFRLRNAGTDRTTSNYYTSTQGLTFGNVANNLTGQATVGIINQGIATSVCKNSLDVYDPFIAANKTVVTGTGYGGNTGGTPTGYRNGVLYELTNSNDGFTISAQSGTITGNLSVYGYKK